MEPTCEAGSRKLQHGYFDHVAAVFARLAHPIILVEECALLWMGVRYMLGPDCDLLVGNSQVKAVTAELLATGDYAVAEQDLGGRLKDPFVARVARLRYTGEQPQAFQALSLWSEAEYQLSVDGATVAVPDIAPLYSVVAEARYDPGKPGVVASLTMEGRAELGIRVLPLVRALTTTTTTTTTTDTLSSYTIHIPTLPRMLDALLRQHKCRERYYDEQERNGVSVGFSDKRFMPSLPMYHVDRLIRYLHLERDHQRQKLLPELAPETRRALEGKLNTYRRKAIFSLAGGATAQNGVKGRRRRLMGSHPVAASE